MGRYTVEGYQRINKRDGVTGEITPGPWHHMHGVDSSQPQAWCGSKVKAFNTERSKSYPEGQRMCAACEKAVAADQPKAFSRG